MLRSSPLDLPSALPNNWPNPSPQDLEALPYRRVEVGQRQRYYFTTNRVQSNRYTGWNFLPKFLWNEFNPRIKLANFYYFLLAVFQCIPEVSNTGGIPTNLIPLLMILSVDAVFSYFEDLDRIKHDSEANDAWASRYNYQLRRFVDIKASEIAVGDLIQVKVRNIVPADIVLFAVAEQEDPPSGICYVETRSLDGETNLKMRQALGITYHLMQDIAIIDGLKGEIVMEHPNKHINDFHGIIDLNRFGRETIALENVLLRGSILRTTDWAIGIVVNTGTDTKMVMASSVDREKISQVEILTNSHISNIIILLFALSVAGALGATFYNFDKELGKAWYLQFDPDRGSFWFLNLAYFFILHGSVVPISMYLSVSIARHIQALFMQQDLEMYYSKKDSPMQVRNCRLNEDLGQITHLFTDKTGTLTRNMLDFRKASINGVLYGTGITEIGRNVWNLQGKKIPEKVLLDEERAQSVAVPHVSFYCPKYDADIREPMTSIVRAKIQQFYRCLSICHEVVCERDNDGSGVTSYSAPNPDDECHVHAAAYFGFRFKERRERFLVIENRDRRNAPEEVEVLEIISFTSARRRMSVIIKDTDDVIRILTKGADIAILPRLSPGQDKMVDTTVFDMRKLAVEGLRTLLLGVAEIPAQRFYEWHKQYHESKNDAQQRELLKAGKENHISELEDMIEQNLNLLGCVGVEDKLQYGATGCIRELSAAGISVWLMTGDKEDSAQAVAVSANLLLPKAYMHRINIGTKQINGSNPIADIAAILAQEIDDFDRELVEVGLLNTKPRALLFDGPALSMLLSDRSNHDLNTLLLRMLQRVRTVIATRVTPAEKAGLVRFVRLFLPGSRTLAVGDGANDVSMIREAHVGVGIKGDEGVQAATASEFNISQFRYLSPLLLKHGHWNYVRTSNLICFTFYKNILLNLTLFWFNFNCAYTGQKLFTEGAIQMFNVFFTSFSILSYAVYDHHVGADTLYSFPQLYRCCLNNEFFNNTVFWGWLLNSFFESILLSLIPLYCMGGYDSFEEVGFVSMFGCVIVVNAKMFVLQYRWHWWNIALLLLQFGLLIATYITIGSLAWFDFGLYSVFQNVCTNYSAWLTMGLQLVTIIGKDVYLVSLDRFFNFKPSHIAQEISAGLGKFKRADVVPFVPTLVESPGTNVASPSASPGKSSVLGSGSAKVSVVSLSGKTPDAGSPMSLSLASPSGIGSGSSRGSGGGGTSFLKRINALKEQQQQQQSPADDAKEGDAPSDSHSSAGPVLKPQPSLLKRVAALKKSDQRDPEST